MHILPGGDGQAIPSGGMKAPTLQNCQYLCVDCPAKTLEYSGVDDVPGLVDRNLDHLIALIPQVSWT